MKKFKYKIVENAITVELANFIYNYFLLKRDAVKWMYNNNMAYDIGGHGILGTWTDPQVPNSYSCYGDFSTETLLLKMIPEIEKYTGSKIVPTYSYTRLYKKGDILARHKDRPSCELSATINLGGEPWSIYIDETGADSVIDFHKNKIKPNAPKGTQVFLNAGDMLVYSGCSLEHWREPYHGDLLYGQVFLHYNDANGQFAVKNIFDRREMLGLPYKPRD